jgi:hypothetical protein
MVATSVAQEGEDGLLAAAFTGDRLRSIRARMEKPSPIPGVFDPSPHLHVLIAQPKVGKTTLALTIAKAWAEARSPWTGVAALPGSRALVISREQPPQRIEALLRRLDAACDPPGLDKWPDRILVVARDSELGERARALLTLDSKGIAALRSFLVEARGANDPIGLLVLDSLSRLKLSGVEEGDNDAMSSWLDQLEEIAIEFGVYVVLIHHQGHAARRSPHSAGRGASAIGAVAAVTLLLEKIRSKPHQRRLMVEGSFVLDDELIFDVADPDDPSGTIKFFRLTNALAAYDPVTLVGTGGVSSNELAWRVSGGPRQTGKNPPGAASRLATELRLHWLEQGLVEIVPGPRNSQVIQLVGSHLATVPSPPPGTEAQSGNTTSPSVPLGAHAGGEVRTCSQRDALPLGGEVVRINFGGCASPSIECSEEGLGATPAEPAQSASPLPGLARCADGGDVHGR